MASKSTRVGSRMIDGILELVLVVITWVLFGDSHRIWTALFLAVVAITLYEGLTTMWMGGTFGKRLLGIHVVELDGRGNPSARCAMRRGAMSATLMVMAPFAMLIGLAVTTRSAVGILVIAGGLGGWIGWISGLMADPLGRGFADRVAETMVVSGSFTGAVTSRDLPGYADAIRAPRVTELGRVADVDVRYRARLRRLTDSPVLAGALGLLALAVSLPFTTTELVLGSSAAWVVVFVIHETWLVSRTGATPGHVIAGLMIMDNRTGQLPGKWRSFLRALVLGSTMYVPLLWPLLAISVLLMRLTARGRGLHDLAGRTIVVSDPSLSPEVQRQRSMRMRLGRAG